MIPELTASQWLLAVVASVAMGVSKSGFAGLALVHVLVFAFLFGARDSTGIVLPMLLVGDLGAIRAFSQHAKWEHLWRTLPPACFGVIAGALMMRHISDAAFTQVLGWILLLLSVLWVVRSARPESTARIPRGRLFAWSVGLIAGVTTMLANAGGPIMTLYLLAMGLAKLEFTGTVAWFFFVINAFKVPFSLGLGLIDSRTLALNLFLTPAILLGLVLGRWLIRRVPQRLFDGLLVTFVFVAALRMIGVF